MDFKIDENLPVDVKLLFEAAGHDAKTVIDESLQGASDKKIIDVCRSEERVLITLDTDFSDIRAYPPEEVSGVIILRPSSQGKVKILEILRRALPVLEREVLTRHLIIVEDSRIRVRGKD